MKISNKNFVNKINANYGIIIIESVDSISRDGLDTPTYIIHCKNSNNSVQLKVGAF